MVFMSKQRWVIMKSLGIQAAKEIKQTHNNRGRDEQAIYIPETLLKQLCMNIIHISLVKFSMITFRMKVKTNKARNHAI